jgi:membrane protease YdiL (CAAX protease family)
MNSVPSIASAQPPRVWRFWGTLLWSIALYVALQLAQTAVLAVAMIGKLEASLDLQSAGLAALLLMSNGVVVSAMAIAAVPAVLLVLWLALRIARQSFADYLALAAPRRGEMITGMIAILIFLVAWDGLSCLFGIPLSPPFVRDVYVTSRDSHALVLLLVGLCVAAPVSEELAVRGFMYRGWSQTRLGPWGAIVLSAAAWSVIHVQYTWYFIAQVFILGLMLGYFRYRSGSTLLTVLLHAAVNAVAVVEAALVIHFGSAAG